MIEDKNVFPNGIVRVAATNKPSCMLDLDGGVQRVIETIQQAADHDVDLLVFPESYLPGFPVWTGLNRPIDGHDYFVKFAQSSPVIDGQEIGRIREEARRCGVMVSLGLSERAANSPGCLWNSNVLIDEDGTLLNHHRKLVPTFYEKLVWTPGDASGLRVSITKKARVGSLICGENGNPLARYILMAQGEQIHTASYPAVWPFKDPRNAGVYDLPGAIHVRAAAHAFEAKTFVVVSAAQLDDASIETISNGDAEISDLLQACPRATSMIVDPAGERLESALSEGEGIISADIDLSTLVALRQHHDMAGYYNRPELINVTVNNRRPTGVSWQDDWPESFCTSDGLDSEGNS